MRASQEHMKKIRSHILEAAGKGFREEGYGGLGINGLAKRAGMTSGAFYGHFKSKNQAFKDVVEGGLNDYSDVVSRFKAEYGEEWPGHFLDFYLSKEHVNNLADSCIVPGLSGDIMRADEQTKDIYSKLVTQIINDVASGLPKQDSTDAFALMALLAGSVMMTRCVSDAKLSKEMLDAARHWADKIVDG